MSFKLYESEGCHLCEQAKQLLSQSLASTQQVEQIDIAFEAALIDRFGESIPVLEHVQSGQLLYWPFDLSQLTRWLAQFK